ncbi:hypothetical protein Tco_0937302 [Tanacetum coccineum]|uniref:Xylulose kinase-1 n=1 Tax=Tanacetum coccineum TaxID=301880 RepID=A0ABQ5DEP6_9ASTR
MANLEFCDKHNMVAYLKKPTGSEGFQEIVDFLNESHIRFALTKNPTIYVSLIEKFWQTATVRTVDNGEQEITATVDGKEFTITEASVRRHLQLADVDGISVLPTTKIFAQLSLMGYVLTDDKLTFQKAKEGKGSRHPSEPYAPPSTTQPIHEEPIPNVVSSSHQKTQTPRQALNQSGRDTTTATSLDAAQASGNITKTQSTAIPYVPLPQGIGAGGSPSKVESLEADLKQTKQVYGAAYTKLIMKVKKLEKTIKTSQARRRAKIVVSDDEEDLEDSSKHGRMVEEIDQDAGVTLLKMFTLILEEEGQLVLTAGTVQEVNKDKGKGIMTESEPEQTKTKLQQRQERAGYEAVVRLQEQIDEEERQRSHTLQQLKRLFFDELKALSETTMRRVQTFHPIESEGDKTVPELTTGSSKRDVEVELDHEGFKKQKTNEASRSVQEQPEEEETELPQEDLQQMMMVVPVEEVYILAEMLKKFERDDLDKLWDLVKERFRTTEPTDDKEKELWVELKRLFEPDNDDTLWKL